MAISTEGIIKSITVTIGAGSFKVVSGVPSNGAESCEKVDASSMLDAKKVFLPVPQNEMGDLQFTVANEGSAPTVGAVSTITLTVVRIKKTDGTSTTETYSFSGFVTSVQPTTVDTGTNRYDCYELTIAQTTTTASLT